MKKALITGITGQDGSYLAELLLEKGYEVHGIKRRSSLLNTERIDHLFQDVHEKKLRFHLHFGDLSDGSALGRIISEIRPDEVYNLGAMSHVKVSFESPEYTADVDGLGALRLLEAITHAGLTKSCRYYQASTSELFGLVQETPQREKTPFYPRSPYACAKLYAYWITVNYREVYGLFAANGILFNHESPRRGETFVTRKISRALARIALGMQECLWLGNVNALRDWGHARDFVRAMWLMQQIERPVDLVIATGEQHSVREFAALTARELGFELGWKGKGHDEVGVVDSIRADLPHLKVGQPIVRIDRRYFRPTEVDALIGDASRARELLGWRPETTFAELVHELAAHDLELARRGSLLEAHGFDVIRPEEDR